MIGPSFIVVIRRRNQPLLFIGALSCLRQFMVTESSLKMMKNAFYFTLKTLFLLKIFKILSWLFGHVENGLIRKIRLILKIMLSQPG